MPNRKRKRKRIRLYILKSCEDGNRSLRWMEQFSDVILRLKVIINYRFKKQ